MATVTATKKNTSAPKHTCTRRGNDVRCQCGGPLAVGGTLHPLADLGFGFRGGKFRIDAKYSKRVIGYTGFCMKCRREGGFILQGEKG